MSLSLIEVENVGVLKFSADISKCSDMKIFRMGKVVFSVNNIINKVYFPIL